MSALKKDTVEDLELSLKDTLNDHAVKESIEIDSNLSSARLFQILIRELMKKYDEKVVILIDEYDDPIIKHISNPELAIKNRELLVCDWNTKLFN